jgi:hypothetical protein
MSIGKPTETIAATGARRGAFTLTAVCALLGGLSLWSTSALAACPNEALRTGLSAALPDCRAYEMVSPLDKNGHGVYGGSSDAVIGQAAVGGGAVTYIANGAFPGSVSGTDAAGEYLAVRGGGGWPNESLFPPQAFSYGATIVTPAFAAFSSDLSKAVLGDATDSPPLVAGEQETGGTAKTSNLFVRDNTTGTYSLVNFPAPGLAIAPAPYRPTFDGASADFSTVIFNAPAALTPEAPGGSGGSVENLYAWEADGTGTCVEREEGCIGLVSQIPPAGQVSCGPAGPACISAPTGGRFGGENAIKNAFSHNGSFVRIISSDGLRIFFTANSNGDLYVRENGETTVQVDAPQGGAGPGGGGLWATAAGDGSRVFFYDNASAKLTNDTVPNSGVNLYSYDTDTGTLTDLTPFPKAEVLGVANEASQDGSYLYFVANGVLTSVPNSLGQTASPGNCQESLQVSCSLYLSHDGEISFIHTISGAAAEKTYTRLSLLAEHTSSRVTPDGHHLAFFAEGSSSSGGGNSFIPVFGELFEYSADSGEVNHLCVCGASEFRGHSDNILGLEQETSTFQYTRALSDDGSRLFFESYQPLLPGDTNGQPDVYEFEQGGVGGCQVASGCLYLVSSGTSAAGSWFVDASASGDDVFFTTEQELVSADTDQAFDLYDARVEGGFPQPPSPSPCLGDGCLNVPPAPIDATPASLTFSGAGDVPGEVKAQVTSKAKLTSAQKLVEAVKACDKKRKSQRKSCDAQARKRYAKTAGGRSTRARHANTNGRAGK